MIRAWRNELGFCLVLALAVAILTLALGQPLLWLLLFGAGYLLWHLYNLLRLQFWIARRPSGRLPFALGIWEAIFDGLQRDQLRRRRRGHRMTGFLANYRDAAGSLPDALVVLTESGTVRWINPAATRLLGLRWPADRGAAITSLVDHPVLQDDLAEGFSSRPLEVPSPVNGAWMLSIEIAAPFGDRRDRLLVARDVTKSFRLEQARRDFIANVSHELRTPITVFRGYLEPLQEAAANSQRWRRPLAQMTQQCQRMQDLVERLLSLSRLEMSDQPQDSAPVPVAEVLAEIATEARALSGDQGHDIRLDADPALLVLGDEGELRSAFSNLVFNAVRHTAPGTLITIEWQGDETGADLTVRDRGAGLAAYHLPRLTERFYRVDDGRSRDSGGTGLGLSIVKQVLERSSAELSISSQVGRGTTFGCHFPASAVRLAPPAFLDSSWDPGQHPTIAAVAAPHAHDRNISST